MKNLKSIKLKVNGVTETRYAQFCLKSDVGSIRMDTLNKSLPIYVQGVQAKEIKVGDAVMFEYHTVIVEALRQTEKKVFITYITKAKDWRGINYLIEMGIKKDKYVCVLLKESDVL